MGGRHAAVQAWEQPMGSMASSRGAAPQVVDPLTRTYSLGERRIIEWLKKVRFRRQLVGGLSEQSVWKQIQELDELYLRALGEERARYDALLAEYARLRRTRDGPAQPAEGPWGSTTR